eukprot:scaffold167585_cov58-Attheya_sp.AAC.3
MSTHREDDTKHADWSPAKTLIEIFSSVKMISERDVLERKTRRQDDTKRADWTTAKPLVETFDLVENNSERNVNERKLGWTMRLRVPIGPQQNLLLKHSIR